MLFLVFQIFIDWVLRWILKNVMLVLITVLDFFLNTNTMVSLLNTL